MHPAVCLILPQWGPLGFLRLRSWSWEWGNWLVSPAWEKPPQNDIVQLLVGIRAHVLLILLILLLPGEFWNIWEDRFHTRGKWSVLFAGNELLVKMVCDHSQQDLSNRELPPKRNWKQLLLSFFPSSYLPPTNPLPSIKENSRGLHHRSSLVESNDNFSGLEILRTVCSQVLSPLVPSIPSILSAG